MHILIRFEKKKKRKIEKKNSEKHRLRGVPINILLVQVSAYRFRKKIVEQKISSFFIWQHFILHMSSVIVILTSAYRRKYISMIPTFILLWCQLYNLLETKIQRRDSLCVFWQFILCVKCYENRYCSFQNRSSW